MNSNVLISILSPFVGILIGLVLSPFLKSYSSKKGENLATREDIHQLTATVERIKADISDVVWDRQKQWELRRDVVLDAVRMLADLEDALIDLDSKYGVPVEKCTDEVKGKLKTSQQGSFSHLVECCSAYTRALRITDLVVGGQTSKTLSNYFQFAGVLVKNSGSRQRFLADPATKKRLQEMGNAIIQSARETLGIKDAVDLDLIDNSN